MSDDPAAARPNGPPAGEDDARTPFERFEDVLRKVVSVPKTEVDKRRGKGR